MKLDPLLIVTVALSVGLLLVLGRYALTGDYNKELLAVLATSVGALITTLAARNKGKDKDDAAD